MGETKSTEKGSFFKGVKNEFSKITWPDKNTLIKQSIVVVVLSTILGLLITFIDTLVKYGVNFITTL